MASAAVSLLRDPRTIRERCQNVFDAELEHFEVRLERLPDVVERVARVTKGAYGDGPVPIHGRFRHFGTRLHDFLAATEAEPADERARALIDLVVVSVLLDAGAGDAWRYRDARSGATIGRSEGLALASFDLFASGAFSHRGEPAVTAEGLASLGTKRLADGFQVGPDNPLVGLEGRAALLRALGSALESREDLFGSEHRPGHLFDHAGDDAAALLGAVLDGLGTIWPSRLRLDGESLGDVWRHSRAGGDGETAGLVPFHKLSQWLTYSLLEPFAVGGRTVRNPEALTGLAEYRNGGLFVDAGVLHPRHESVTAEVHAPDSEVVVEWRALTVVLLDRVAEALGLPLAEVLEGGTWRAGREIARELRPTGGPPIRVESDGTLF